MHEFSIAAIKNYCKSSDLKQPFANPQFCSPEVLVDQSLSWALSLISWCQSQGAGGTTFFSGGSVDESASKIIQVVGWIQLLGATGQIYEGVGLISFLSVKILS